MCHPFGGPRSSVPKRAAPLILQRVTPRRRWVSCPVSKREGNGWDSNPVTLSGTPAFLPMVTARVGGVRERGSSPGVAQRGGQRLAGGDLAVGLAGVWFILFCFNWERPVRPSQGSGAGC